MPLDTLSRAAFQPQTLDRSSRTVEAVLSTGAPVLRYGFDGPFTEQLDIRQEAVDLGRLPVPILDGHRKDSIGAILGTLEAVRFEDGAMVGTIRLSARQPELLDDIEAGVIRSVSIGYTVENFEERAGPNGRKVRMATRWTLAEASFVSIPADPKATIRSNPMSTTEAAPTVTTPEPPVVETRADVNSEIRALGETFDLPADFANGLIDREASIEDARSAALDALQTRRQTQRITAVHQIDSPEEIVTRMAEAVYARANPDHDPSEAARAYLGFTTLDIARDCLTRRGAVRRASGPDREQSRLQHIERIVTCRTTSSRVTP